MLYLRSFHRLILISLALLGLSISSVNAAIVDNGTYTTDESSALDWLDLTESLNRSYNDVSSEFGVGGDFEGWRYATTDEVSTFWDNAGGTPPFVGGAITGQAPWIGELLALWGIGLSVPSQDLSFAITGSAHPTGDLWLSALVDNHPGTSAQDDNAVVMNSNFLFSSTNLAAGSALVRQSGAVPAVPIPAAIWLFGTALIGFVGFARRRKIG